MNVTRNLKGGDRRSIGAVKKILPAIKNQQQFDTLFRNMFLPERVLAMRSADAVEKLTRENRHWLEKHKSHLLSLLHISPNIELKWHLLN